MKPTSALRAALVGGVLSLTTLASPASAQALDRDWGQCVWNSAPQSAAAWLEMDRPDWRDEMFAPTMMLGFRVLAACGDIAGTMLTSNREPDWSAMAFSLAQTRPSNSTGPDSRERTVQFCPFETNTDGIFRGDIVLTVAGNRLTVFEQFYRNLNGRSQPLPQLLFDYTEPGETASGPCQEIASDGSLINA